MLEDQRDIHDNYSGILLKIFSLLELYSMHYYKNFPRCLVLPEFSTDEVPIEFFGPPESKYDSDSDWVPHPPSGGPKKLN